MPRIRALRKAEDIAAVPPDQPVLIETAEETPEPVEVDVAAPPEPEPQPRPAPEPEPEPDDERTVLTRRLAELERAEQAARDRSVAAERERDAAIRHAQDREQEANRYRDGQEQAQYDAILNAIGAATAESEAASRDYKAALTTQDWDAATEAQRRMSRSEARLTQLEDGKAAFEARREEPKPQPRPTQQPPADPVAATIDAMTSLSTPQRQWLREHRDAVTDQRKNARLGAAHFDALDAGHAQDSTAYFEFLEERLGYRKPPQREPDPDPDPEPAPAPTRRNVPMSAPVSRDAPSISTGRPSTSKVTLTPEQREAAKIAGIDEVTYAKGVIQLQERKRQGHYQERG